MRYRELDEHLKEKCTKITLTCPNTCGAMDFTRDEVSLGKYVCVCVCGGGGGVRLCVRVCGYVYSYI